MKQYNRIMAGPKSMYADDCYKNGYIGVDFAINEDLTKNLFENWRDFNAHYRPIWLKSHPDKSKIAAGLACGMLWTVCKGLNRGDVVLCPDGKGNYFVGEIDGDYIYSPESALTHQRKVNWFHSQLDRADMSQVLKNSSGSIGTTSDLTKYAEEIESLIEGKRPSTITSTDETIEDPSVFALEKHLEEFLISNWSQTELGTNYDVFIEDGQIVGQQYPTDTGYIDILAISKDKKTLLVVELKKGRVSDNVVGQIQRYMGYVKYELAEPGQEVKGVIIGLEDDIRIKRALSVTTNIDFYRYEVNFKLFKG